MLYYVFSGSLSFPAYVPEIKFNNNNSCLRHIGDLCRTLGFNLFFIWFPLCRDETGRLVTPTYGYVCYVFPLTLYDKFESQNELGNNYSNRLTNDV